jgi:hypothetical protein
MRIPVVKAVEERLGLRTALAFDPHFRQYGYQLLGRQ